MSQKIITQKAPDFRWEKGWIDWRRALVFAWYPTDRLRTQETGENESRAVWRQALAGRVQYKVRTL